MSNGYAQEALDEILESMEYDESDESDEAAPFRRPLFRRPPPKTATGKGLYQPRPQTNYVTQVQLQAALARVGTQIKANSDAIKAVNGRINTISADQAKLKKQVEDGKKDMTNLTSNVQLSALLPLLIKPTSKPITADVGDGLAVGDKVVLDSPSSLAGLLPIILLGGLGTGTPGTTGGTMGGMDNMTMLLLVLAMTKSL